MGLKKNYRIKRLIKDIQKKGLIKTGKIYLSKIDHRMFDYKYNINTHRDLRLKNLSFSSINKKNGFDYETISPFLINKILTTINIYEEDILVDFGCGKGRVLLIASQYKFKKIIGIEFSRELVDIALKNIMSCKGCNNFDIDIIKIVEGDALDYKYNNDETIFYLYNPFTNIILDQLCEKIKKSIYHRSRRVYIIYVNPIYDNIIVANGFNKIKKINLINQMCYVYSNE